MKAQYDCAFKPEIIPVHRQVYMIGETHLDGGSFHVKTPEELRLIRNSLIREESVRSYLVSKCNVDHFVLEEPVSTEYFYNKYLRTGDSSWVRFFFNAEYQIGVLNSIIGLAKSNPAITISCIDGDRASSAQVVIDALFWLSFFEPFPDVYAPEIGNYKMVYGNLPFPPDLLETEPAFNDSIYPFMKYIWEARTLQTDTAAAILYTKISATLSDKNIMLALQHFYGENFDYVNKLLHSYYYSYSNHLLNQSDFDDREQILFANFETVLNKHPRGSFCIQIGAYHVMPNSVDVLRSFIQYQLKTEPYCFYLMQQTMAQAYEKYIYNVRFDFPGYYCFSEINENESLFMFK